MAVEILGAIRAGRRIGARLRGEMRTGSSEPGSASEIKNGNREPSEQTVPSLSLHSPMLFLIRHSQLPGRRSSR